MTIIPQFCRAPVERRSTVFQAPGARRGAQRYAARRKHHTKPLPNTGRHATMRCA